MGFITVPNSIVTGAYVDAGKLNENFLVFTDGLQKGQKDASVNNVSADRLEPATLVIGGDRDITGAIKGKRIYLPTHKWNGSTNFTSSVSDYRPYRLSTATLSWNVSGFVMNRPGSIIGLHGYVECTSYSAQGTVAISPIKNGTAYSGIDAIDFDITSATIYEDSAAYSRGVYTFVAGDIISVNFDVSVATTSNTTSGSIILEVILDA